MTMRVTAKGQVTIPIEIRERLGIFPQTEVEFELRGNAARLVKVLAKRTRGRGADVVAKLHGKATVRMSTDQILALTRKRK
jgi:AbrB family looped-hinge helix DNA binding protein